MLKQGLNQKLLQKLSPQQIQFIQLLQLNLTELEARLEEELVDNPALEKAEE
ncbi:MAG: RNA polymerase sigma-54 factor, partial [Bacteroidetes bacterium]|nr:RNA polymerase sigma-54 factor [Bacteroidota bacterium]